MTAETASGLERAIFGEVDVRHIDDWLDRHITGRLGKGVNRVLFRTGRIGAVYGLQLLDGTDVVVKVPRGTPAIEPLAAAVGCQRHLAEHHYPCPTPLDGPAVTDGRVAVIETLLDVGETGDIRQDATRRAAAASLAQQVALLRDLSAFAAALTDPPAWARYRDGPWPVPHDSIFDFTDTPAGFGWLDDLAAAAASRAMSAPGPTVIGHSDWYVGNLRFAEGAMVAAYDWDSLVADTEPVIAGFAAGSYTAGNATGPSAPTPAEVGDFLRDYASRRPAPFTAPGRAAAAAAATWVLAYNARCELTHIPRGGNPVDGSSLSVLAQAGHHYLTLRW